MIESLLISAISILIGYFFLRIGNHTLLFFPGVIVLIAIMNLTSGSVNTSSQVNLKDYGLSISWNIIMIGVFVLLLNRGLVWWHTIIILLFINITLYFLSYYWMYIEGKKTFLGGIIMSFVFALGYAIRFRHYTDITTILSLGGLCLFIITHLSYYFFKTKGPKTSSQLIYQRELSIYYFVAILLYQFIHSLDIAIVSILGFVTLSIAIRQGYLSKKKTLERSKKRSLSGRSLLEGQKVLERYDDQNRSFNLHLFQSLINKGYMPSEKGMIVLQYSQIILIVLLIAYTIYGLQHQLDDVLVRYRLGVLCFVITLFGIRYQEKFISHYKTITLALITGSYYITLFDSARNTAFFVWGSLIRLCLNMISSLFYAELFPQIKHILNRHDILFRLVMIILSSIITILSLVWLPINGSILFALGAIIIGLTGYFSYHIWNQQATNRLYS